MITNQWAISIDLGGTKIEVALVNSSGLLHDRLRVLTDSKKGYKAIFKKITETVHQLCDKNRNAVPSAIGIGIPGQISRLSGIVHYALKAATENLKVLPAKLHNDSGVIGAAAYALHSMDKT
jgi:predicted NBD/HSP70 family sugar kinase